MSVFYGMAKLALAPQIGAGAPAVVGRRRLPEQTIG